MKPQNIHEIFSGRFALFELGFRPFFLCAGISAAFLIAAWLAALQGHATYGNYYGAYLWHAHEMVFGYSIAVIAGFLLTSVRNWTGMETARHGALAGLVLLWLLGRVLPFFADYLHTWLIAFVDLLFLPVLGAVLAVPLVKSNNRRNLFFIPLFAAFTVANILMHLEALQLLVGWGLVGEKLSLGLVMVVISVIGGRVIPFFSKTAIAGYQSNTTLWLDRLAIVSVLVFVLCFAFIKQGSSLLGIVALFAAVVNLLRLKSWYSAQIWRNPLLWVLYVSYLWLIVGFVLFFIEGVLTLNGRPALHAITVGTIGGITLGMMARVSLGHTGRTLKPLGVTTLAFVLMNLSALLRVFLPLLEPERYQYAIQLSGGLWLVAFGLFVVVYTPVLLFPRVDGRPG